VTVDATPAVRVRVLLHELLDSAVARREFRRRPDVAVATRGLSAPAPPGPLPVRVMGVSAWLRDEDLLGRWPFDPPADVALMEGTELNPALLLCAAGARPLALLHAPESRAEDLARWARSRRLAAMLGPTAFVPRTDPARGGFADSADDPRPARAGDGGWRQLLVSPSDDLVVAGWLALLMGWDAWLGVLLGYPSCCAEAFPSRWAEAARSFDGDVSRTLLPGPLEWSSNSFVRVLGAALPLHFPCSPTCSRTRRSTTWHLAVLALADPPAAQLTRRLLESPVVLGPDGQVVALVGGTLESSSGLVRYDPEQVRFAGPDLDLVQAVRSHDQADPELLAQVGGRIVHVAPSVPHSPEVTDAIPVVAAP
jgi:hypothetical protein